ncbi:DUF2269 family protein [Pseudomonas sp. R5(2019)]|uniref:DUF2269 family protein n=1 Tax=Pseudomonas sp. R5(2019) TaxID=2697566 RepID=UPI001412B087|nr:DUF2269 family protein [Pseudomonas sp. R5(2019)]NBA97891.1 DUF2269 family protein [Pseudomonas sp. R5(2019)]
METLTALKLAHGLATLVVFGCIAALGYRAWRVRAQGYTTLVQRPWLFIWLLMGLGLFSLPFSGWWLVHTVGWPLGQTWLLGGALLYMLGCICWLLLPGRLGRVRWAATLAGVAGVMFVAVLVLMLVKPV